MGQMLTAKQVAEVKGCSYQYVKRIIKEGKLQAQEILNDKNRKTYLVPLEALDEELQQKWYQMNLENPPEEISTPEPVTDKKAVDHFSESERQEIDFWISLVEQWQQMLIRHSLLYADWNIRTKRFLLTSCTGSGKRLRKMI